MKLEQILEEQFKKLVPYKPLTAPEMAMIEQSFKEYIQQFKQTIPLDFSPDLNTENYEAEIINQFIENKILKKLNWGNLNGSKSKKFDSTWTKKS